MERLTYYDHGKARIMIDGTEYTNEFVRRLAAYEDTGLTPEEIEVCKVALMGKSIAEITEFEGLSIERMKELAKAERDGHLVVLPCKVGDTVYRVEKVGKKHRIAEHAIEKIEIGRSGKTRLFFSWKNSGYESVHEDEIGKKIFLTREEAEKALEVI